MTNVSGNKILDLTLLDYLALSRANSSNDLYGFVLKEECEFAGKQFEAGPNYQRLGKLARYGLLDRSPEKESSPGAPDRRMYPIRAEGQEMLANAVPIIGRILLGVDSINLEPKNKFAKPVNAADATLIDLLILSRANRSEAIYGYYLQEDYEFAGKVQHAGSIVRKLGKLANFELLDRSPTKEPSPTGPARRMYTIRREGQELLLNAAPIFGRILQGVRPLEQQNKT